MKKKSGLKISVKNKTLFVFLTLSFLTQILFNFLTHFLKFLTQYFFLFFNTNILTQFFVGNI